MGKKGRFSSAERTGIELREREQNKQAHKIVVLQEIINTSVLMTIQATPHLLIVLCTLRAIVKTNLVKRQYDNNIFIVLYIHTTSSTTN